MADVATLAPARGPEAPPAHRLSAEALEAHAAAAGGGEPAGAAEPAAGASPAADSTVRSAGGFSARSAGADSAARAGGLRAPGGAGRIRRNVSWADLELGESLAKVQVYVPNARPAEFGLGEEPPGGGGGGGSRGGGGGGGGRDAQQSGCMCVVM